jgi:hypothetical protein
VNSVQPVRLALSPSPALASLIVLLHGAAAACLLTILTGWSAAAAAALFLALGVAAARDRALLAARHSPRIIEIWPSGEAFCILASGKSLPVEAVPDGAVARQWVSLRLRAPWRRSLLVASGMLTVRDHRWLRLWALWGRLPAVAWRQLRASL